MEEQKWIRNKEVMTFSNFSRKHFLTSPYEYSNERVGDVIASQFFILYMNFFFFCVCVCVCVCVLIQVKAYPSYQNISE